MRSAVMADWVAVGRNEINLVYVLLARMKTNTATHLMSLPSLLPPVCTASCTNY